MDLKYSPFDLFIRLKIYKGHILFNVSNANGLGLMGGTHNRIHLQL